MGQVRYNVAASLDGFIADPDGGYDWIVDEPEIDFEGSSRSGHRTACPGVPARCGARARTGTCYGSRTRPRFD